MDQATLMALGKIGAVAALSLAGFGSALGTGAAASAAVGAWKKAYAQEEKPSFLLFTFVGAPLSQTIYGMIVMFAMLGKVTGGDATLDLIGLGVFSGLAMGASSWMQGRAAAGACHAQSDTGQGFTNYLAALGVVETVAIFVMVFTLIALG